MSRVVLICGFIIGLAAIGYAIALFAENTKQPVIVEREAVVVQGAELGETPIYAMTPIRFRIQNNSNVAIRFIGGPNGCQPGGCLKTTGPCPLTIEANSVAEIPLDVSVSTLGSFQLEVCVYLDLAGVGVARTVYLTGTGVPATEEAATLARP